MSTKEVIILAKNKSSNKINPVWLRINAFLDLKSQTTQRTYLGIVKEWCSFLGVSAGSEDAATAIVKAKDLHAIAYKNWLHEQPGQKPRLESSNEESRDLALSDGSQKKRKKDGTQSTLTNSTIQKKFAALRRIYRMLIAADLGIASNPFAVDKVPITSSASGQKRPTEMIDFKLVTEILSLPDITTVRGLRDKAIMSFLFGAGLRRSEVVSIRLGDIAKSSAGTVYVRLRATKGKRDSDQAIPHWAAEIILRFKELRESQGAKGGDYIFVRLRGKNGDIPGQNALSDSALYKMFKAYCAMAGAGSFKTPHSARATAITKLLSDGLSHREVQEFSRHASVQMVEVYDKRRFGVDKSPAKDLEY